jgi:hypothetical protein
MDYKTKEICPSRIGRVKTIRHGRNRTFTPQAGQLSTQPFPPPSFFADRRLPYMAIHGKIPTMNRRSPATIRHQNLCCVRYLTSEKKQQNLPFGSPVSNDFLLYIKGIVMSRIFYYFIFASHGVQSGISRPGKETTTADSRRRG